MPKKMFFNIPEAKQQMIIEVAIEEFTSKSFENVSVSSIVRKANIPRGSFYTYFEDLDELFNFIISKIKKERFKYAKDYIKEANGNFFIFINKLFAYDFETYSTKHRYSLFRNYIHYIQINNRGNLKDNLITPLAELFKGDITFDKIFDFEKYNINIEEFEDLIEITMIIMINTYMKSESKELNNEQIIALFKKRMKILEYGITKK